MVWWFSTASLRPWSPLESALVRRNCLGTYAHVGDVTIVSFRDWVPGAAAPASTAVRGWPMTMVAKDSPAFSFCIEFAMITFNQIRASLEFSLWYINNRSTVLPPYHHSPKIGVFIFIHVYLNMIGGRFSTVQPMGQHQDRRLSEGGWHPEVTWRVNKDALISYSCLEIWGWDNKQRTNCEGLVFGCNEADFCNY